MGPASGTADGTGSPWMVGGTALAGHSVLDNNFMKEEAKLKSQLQQPNSQNRVQVIENLHVAPSQKQQIVGNMKLNLQQVQQF
jgi:hypothetical protein